MCTEDASPVHGSFILQDHLPYEKAEDSAKTTAGTYVNVSMETERRKCGGKVNSIYIIIPQIHRKSRIFYSILENSEKEIRTNEIFSKFLDTTYR